MIDPKLVQLIIGVLGAEESEIKPEAEFLLDLNASPMELAELINKVEEEYEITLPFEDEASFPTNVEELDLIIQDLCL